MKRKLIVLLAITLLLTPFSAGAKSVAGQSQHTTQYVEEFNSGEGLWAARNLDGVTASVADGSLIIQLKRNSTYFVPNSSDATLGAVADYATTFEISSKLNANKLIDPATNSIVPEIQKIFRQKDGFNPYGIYWGYRDNRNFYMVLVKGVHFTFGKVVNGTWVGLGWEPLLKKDASHFKSLYEKYKNNDLDPSWFPKDVAKDYESIDEFRNDIGSSYANDHESLFWSYYLELAANNEYVSNFNSYNKNHKNLAFLLKNVTEDSFDTLNDFIVQPMGDDNVIRVVQKENNIKIFINGSEVYSSNEPKYITELGRFGVMMQQPGILQVDRFSAKIGEDVGQEEQSAQTNSLDNSSTSRNSVEANTNKTASENDLSNATHHEGEYLAAVQRGKTWGFVDKTGTFAIAPQFQYAVGFTEGLAPVEIDKKWGYIDQSGQFVIKPQFEDLEPFKEGLASVKSGGKLGYINQSGEFVIKPQFDAARSFTEGLAAVEIGGKWGYISKSGQLVIKPQFDYTTQFQEGLAKVVRGGKTGFIDKSGQVAIKPQFDRAGDFSCGLAWATSGGIWGYIDKSGQFVIKPQFEKGFDFSENLARVWTDKGAGYIDKSGRMVINSQFDGTFAFSEGLARVESGGKWGFIDKTGQIVIEPQFEKVWDFKEGLAPIEIDQKWGYIDKSGQLVIKPQFDLVTYFTSSSKSKKQKQWDKEAFEKLFPQPGAGWSASEVKISESPTFAQKSGLAGLLKMSASLMGKGSQAPEVRYELTREYQQAGKKLYMKIDSEAIQESSQILAIHGYGGYEDGKLVPLSEQDLPDQAALQRRGIQSCEIDNHLCITGSNGLMYTKMILIGEYGAVDYACEYAGCEDALNSLAERSKFGSMDAFARFKHRKVGAGENPAGK